jgi:hypothetical protein
MAPALAKEHGTEKAGATKEQSPAINHTDDLSPLKNPSRREFLTGLFAAAAAAQVPGKLAAEQVQRIDPGPSGSQSQLVWLKVFDAANTALRQENPNFSGQWRFPEDPLKVGEKVSSSGDHLATVSAIDGYTLRATAGFGNAAVRAVNALFAEHNLDSRLQERGHSYNGLVSGAVEDIKFPFERKGREVELKIDETSYEGVSKKDPTFFSAPSLTEPAIGLPTSNGVGLLMFKASAVTGLNSENVLAHSQTILNALTPDTAASRAYQGGVQFPKVDFRATSKPSWLIGAQPEGMTMSVDEAILETRFRLDEKGGESTTGAAIATARGIKRSYTIDDSFVVVTYNKQDPTTILNATLVTKDAFVRAAGE